MIGELGEIIGEYVNFVVLYLLNDYGYDQLYVSQLVKLCICNNFKDYKVKNIFCRYNLGLKYKREMVVK